jgi:tetratricopeptide (TPR) repeat protein
MDTVAPGPSSNGVFVGRLEEMRRLTAASKASAAGHGRVVLLTGEPGIGKSRIVRELAGVVGVGGAAVLVGRCHEGEGAPAYWPWIQLIRMCLRADEGGKVMRAIGPAAAEVARLVPELLEEECCVAPPALQPAQARFRLFEAITTLFKHSAQRCAQVLVLEDLHCADDPSLLLLQFLGRQVSESRLLVVGTCRDTEISPCLGKTLAELSRQPEFDRLQLRGLAMDDVGRLVEHITSSRPSADWIARIHRETEGNPLFVSEVVRLLASSGHLVAAERDCSRPFVLPQGVGDIIARRLQRLSDGCRRTLEVAAVLGREFAVTMLGRLTGLPANRVLEVLMEAVAADVLAEVQDALARFRFTHALIREALYQGMSAAQRVVVHRQVGEALEALYRCNRNGHLPELAYHFFEAAVGGDARKAVDYAVLAAEQSLARLGYEEAVSHYGRALQAVEVLAHGSPSERCELLLATAGAQGRAGQTRAARASFQQAAEVARQLGDATRLARAALGIGQVCRDHGHVEEAVAALLEEALIAMGDGDSPLRARLLARLAVALAYSDTSDRSRTLWREATEVARRVRDPEALGYALFSARHPIAAPDDVRERLSTASELVAIATGVNNKAMALEGRFWRASALLELGEVSAADTEIHAIARGAAELQQCRWTWLAALLQTMQALLDGRYAQAEGLAHEAATVGQRWSPHMAAQIFTVQMFGLRREQGRLGELETPFAALVREYPAVSVYRCGLAFLYAEIARGDGARVEFERAAAQDFADLPRDGDWLIALVLLSSVCVFLGDQRRAATLYQLLLPFAGRTVVGGAGALVVGSVNHYLGLLGTAMSAWEKAMVHFQDALVLHARLGSRPLVAHTQYAYACMLLARDDPEDSKHAGTLLARAASTAQALGMRALQDRVELAAVCTAGAGSRVAGGWVGVVGAAARDNGYLAVGDAPNGNASVGLGSHGASAIQQQSLFRKEGDYWTIAYGGSLVRLRDSAGLRHLACLLRHPGKDIDAIALAAADGGGHGPPDWSGERVDARGLNARPSDAGGMLDQQARAAYKRRASELREDLEEAHRFNDVGRAAKAQAELEFLLHELSRAVGLHGRARRAGGLGERARVNVTRAIRDALQKIGRQHAALGRHLVASLRTGRFCAYVPDPPVPEWRF